MRLRCASRRRSASAGPSLTGEHWRPSDSNRSLSTFEPISVPAREVRREKVRRGQRPRGHFWRHRPISGRQRPCYPASAAAKPRKVKNHSDRGRKPDLRGTAWWARQDSNLQPSGYEPLALTIELRAPTAFLATGEAPGQSLAPAGAAAAPRMPIFQIHSPKPATLLPWRISAVRRVVGSLTTPVSRTCCLISPSSSAARLSP
jgi:hypothetical protein